MKINRLAVVTWVCALLLGAAGAGGTAHAAQLSAEIDAPRTEVVTAGSTTTVLPTFDVASYNAQFKSTPAETVSDLTKMAAAGADIIGLQEMGARDKRDAVRAQFVDCSTCEFDAFMTDLPEQNATPILYRWSEFRLESTGTRQVSEATYVGPSGAGPSTVKAKFINYVELRHRATGQVVYVLNNHTVASVQGSDGGRDLRHPERLELYRKHMEGLQALITELPDTGAAVLATGDFNVNYRKDYIVQDTLFPFDRTRQVETAANWEALGMPELGTHPSDGTGNRLIDYVFYSKNTPVTPESQQILEQYTSDHRPVLVRFTIGS
jgi:endonuclease/exonuclease/phosphatase family metal-dependent hydrolase